MELAFATKALRDICESEAIAKANCVEDVTDAMVIEAFNLLRMSIISVEKDDIEVEDDEGEVSAPADGGGDSPMAEGTANDEVAEDGTPAPRTAPPHPRPGCRLECRMPI